MFMPFALMEKPSSGWNLRWTLPQTMVIADPGDGVKEDGGGKET